VRNVARIDDRLKHLFDVSWILSPGACRTAHVFDRTSVPLPQEHTMQHLVQHPAHHHPSGSLRLTRRGRAVLLLALVTLLLAAFSLGRVGSEAAPRAESTPLAQTVVQPGETLWSVAKRVAPGHDPRAVVLRLRALNDLDGGMVRAGQLLLLPR
jgi:hypothetical protein